MAGELEPMNIQTFGGAKVNMNDVKSTQVVKNEKTGKETFVINFKNGVKVQYPKQAASNMSTINSVLVITDDEFRFKSNYTDVNRFYGLEFTGVAQRFDEVRLDGSQNCKINVSDRDKYDNVIILDDEDTGKIFRTKNNTVIGRHCGVYENGERIEIPKGDEPSVHHEGDRREQLK